MQYYINNKMIQINDSVIRTACRIISGAYMNKIYTYLNVMNSMIYYYVSNY